jgi:hypothetical protein
VYGHPDSVRRTTCGTGSTAAKPQWGIAASCARCTTNKCTGKAGTSLFEADASNSDHPRSSTRIVDPSPTHSAADHHWPGSISSLVPRPRVRRVRPDVLDKPVPSLDRSEKQHPPLAQPADRPVSRKANPRREWSPRCWSTRRGSASSRNSTAPTPRAAAPQRTAYRPPLAHR